MDILIGDFSGDNTEERGDTDATGNEEDSRSGISQSIFGRSVVGSLNLHLDQMSVGWVADQFIECSCPVARRGDEEREMMRGLTACEGKRMPLERGESRNLNSIIGTNGMAEVVLGVRDGEEGDAIATAATEGQSGVYGQEEIVIKAIQKEQNSDRNKVLPQEWDMKSNKEQPCEVEEVNSREESVPRRGETSKKSCHRNQENHDQENEACDSIPREHRVIVLFVGTMECHFQQRLLFERLGEAIGAVGHLVDDMHGGVAKGMKQSTKANERVDRDVVPGEEKRFEKGDRGEKVEGAPGHGEVEVQRQHSKV